MDLKSRLIEVLMAFKVVFLWMITPYFGKLIFQHLRDISILRIQDKVTDSWPSSQIYSTGPNTYFQIYNQNIFHTPTVQYQTQ